MAEMDAKTKARIKAELKKIRANPDYLPPICLECGQELGKPVIIGSLFGIKIEGKCIGVEHEEDLLCSDCMDNEIITKCGHEEKVKGGGA